MIDAAGAKLLTLAPNVRLIKDDNLENDLLAGEISVGVMYTSEVFQALNSRPSLKVAFPSEGLGFGVMPCFIPKHAPDPDAALAFLNYILDPARGALCFETLGYYSTFKASDPLIDDEDRPLLTLPPNVSQANMEMIENISPEASAEHSKVWTAFKAACGQ
jgi:spermidine/putrescine transport system substrate-binding protein